MMVLVSVNLPVFTLEVNAEKAAFQYEIPKEAFAPCGAKLSEVPVETKDGRVQWINEEEILKEGEKTVEAVFIPYDGTVHQKIKVKVIVEHANKRIHVLENMPETYLIHMSHKPDTPATEGKPGNYEYLKCNNCGKYFDMKGNEHEESWFIKRYVAKTDISVTLGKEITLDQLVKNGQEDILSMEIEDKDTYKLTFDKKTGKIKITTRKKLKNYKKKLENPTIILKDKAGESHSVKVEVKIAKPTEKQVSVVKNGSVLVVGLGPSYRYTVKYNKKDVTGITLTVAPGCVKEAARKEMNEYFKSQMKNKKGSFTFTVRKSLLTKKKITFNAIARYGKNKSLTKEIKQ